MISRPSTPVELKGYPVSALPDTASLAGPLRPLAQTAALLSEECHALDHLVAELYRDVERLQDELWHKAQEVDEGRRRLAERGRQLAEQRKERDRLAQLLDQQQVQLQQALAELQNLQTSAARQQEVLAEREAARLAMLEQRLKSVESERDELRQKLAQHDAAAQEACRDKGREEERLALGALREELAALRQQWNMAQEELAAAWGELSALRQAPPADAPSQAAVVDELALLRQQLAQTQAQLAQSQQQLAEVLARADAAASPPPAPTADASMAERLATLERERLELEAELELVRSRATELQQIVQQQRRELNEQRADITTELRLLRDLIEQQRSAEASGYLPEEEAALVGAAPRGAEMAGPAPDPVVSSVMAQFARLQKDVALRRRKK